MRGRRHVRAQGAGELQRGLPPARIGQRRQQGDPGSACVGRRSLDGLADGDLPGLGMARRQQCARAHAESLGAGRREPDGLLCVPQRVRGLVGAQEQIGEVHVGFQLERDAAIRGRLERGSDAAYGRVDVPQHAQRGTPHPQDPRGLRGPAAASPGELDDGLPVRRPVSLHEDPCDVVPRCRLGEQVPQDGARVVPAIQAVQRARHVPGGILSPAFGGCSRLGQCQGHVVVAQIAQRIEQVDRWGSGLVGRGREGALDERLCLARAVQREQRLRSQVEGRCRLAQQHGLACVLQAPRGVAPPQLETGHGLVELGRAGSVVRVQACLQCALGLAEPVEFDEAEGRGPGDRRVRCALQRLVSQFDHGIVAPLLHQQLHQMGGWFTCTGRTLQAAADEGLGVGGPTQCEQGPGAQLLALAEAPIEGQRLLCVLQRALGIPTLEVHGRQHVVHIGSHAHESLVGRRQAGLEIIDGVVRAAHVGPRRPPEPAEDGRVLRPLDGRARQALDRAVVSLLVGVGQQVGHVGDVVAVHVDEPRGQTRRGLVLSPQLEQRCDPGACRCHQPRAVVPERPGGRPRRRAWSQQGAGQGSGERVLAGGRGQQGPGEVEHEGMAPTLAEGGQQVRQPGQVGPVDGVQRAREQGLGAVEIVRVQQRLDRHDGGPWAARVERQGRPGMAQSELPAVDTQQPLGQHEGCVGGVIPSWSLVHAAGQRVDGSVVVAEHAVCRAQQVERVVVQRHPVRRASEQLQDVLPRPGAVGLGRKGDQVRQRGSRGPPLGQGRLGAVQVVGRVAGSCSQRRDAGGPLLLAGEAGRAREDLVESSVVAQQVQQVDRRHAAIPCDRPQAGQDLVACVVQLVQGEPGLREQVPARHLVDSVRDQGLARTARGCARLAPAEVELGQGGQGGPLERPPVTGPGPERYREIIDRGLVLAQAGPGGATQPQRHGIAW